MKPDTEHHCSPDCDALLLTSPAISRVNTTCNASGPDGYGIKGMVFYVGDMAKAAEAVGAKVIPESMRAGLRADRKTLSVEEMIAKYKMYDAKAAGVDIEAARAAIGEKRQREREREREALKRGEAALCDAKAENE